MSRRLRPAGSRAVLVECGSTAEALALHEAVGRAAPEGLVDAVPGAETLLLVFGVGIDPRLAAAPLAALALDDVAGSRSGRLVELDVVYDGEDLADVGRLLGLDPATVAARHAADDWTVAFCGFAPGFAYLARPSAPMAVPRRAEPRVAVPAGAVALAGDYSAVYPHESPGGWQLLGRTGAAMWDAARTDPALLAPGDRVRFRPVREVVRVAVAPAPAVAAAPSGLEVEAPGFFALVQDLGRPGRAASGVSPSGALDRHALRQANRLVGNPAGAAALELLPAGVVLRARGDQVVALTGADPEAAVDAPDGPRPVPLGTPVALRDGERLRLHAPASGLRSYLAIRGGVAAPAVLGSRARDVLGAVGPAPLAVGDVVPVGDGAAGEPGPAWPEPPARTGAILLHRGPRDDRFTDEALDAVVAGAWAVTAASNRVGLRLEGDRPLAWASSEELPSEGVALGSVQVPPSGQPIVFLADHPVTGGYPVIGVVADEDLDRLAQLAPGAELRFAWADEGAS